MAVDGHLGLGAFVLDSSIKRPPSPTSPTSPTSPAQTPRVQVVCLESIIGVGKSTQMARLKEVYADDPTVAFVDEPDDAWRTFGLLDAFYEKKVGAAVFQLVALATISARLSTALASGATTIVTERSIWSSYLCFSRMLISDPFEDAAYACAFYEIQRAIEAQHRLHVTFAYLDVDSNVGWERMLGRGAVKDTPEDKEVTLGYQAALRAKHELFFDLAAANRVAEQCHPTDSPSQRRANPRLTTGAMRIDGAASVEAITGQLRRLIDNRQRWAGTTFEEPVVNVLRYHDAFPDFDGRRVEPVFRDLDAAAS
jgi:deoxyadenosine/deoxycytidine kinase